MTKYELSRILGIRCAQLSMNAPILISIDEEEVKTMNPMLIALKELQSGALDITIRRNLPRGKFADVNCSQLKFPSDMDDVYTMLNDPH